MLTVTMQGYTGTAAPRPEGGHWVFCYTLTVPAEHHAQALGAIALARLKFEQWTLPGVDSHTPGLYGLLTAQLLPELANYLTLLLPVGALLALSEDSKRSEKLSWRPDH